MIRSGFGQTPIKLTGHVVNTGSNISGFLSQKWSSRNMSSLLTPVVAAGNCSSS